MLTPQLQPYSSNSKSSSRSNKRRFYCSTDLLALGNQHLQESSLGTAAMNQLKWMQVMNELDCKFLTRLRPPFLQTITLPPREASFLKKNQLQSLCAWLWTKSTGRWAVASKEPTRKVSNKLLTISKNALSSLQSKPNQSKGPRKTTMRICRAKMRMRRSRNI